MILAELNGKLPSKITNKEDILTSNVFSFFKYSNRSLFKEYLLKLGLDVNQQESEDAEFTFWPRYDDGTEPDLVVTCGKYYLLFEAKLYSDFSPETKTTDAQIDREISMGRMSADNMNKEFVYIPITAEYYEDKNKYKKYKGADFKFIWTNWQFISSFIEDQLENDHSKWNREFAYDLHSLLVKKRLRSFKGISNIVFKNEIESIDDIFYNVNTSKFKGEFSGFASSLQGFEEILPCEQIIFYGEEHE